MAFVWIPLVATREEKRRNRGISIERASQPVERGIDLAGHMIEPDLVRFEDRAQGVVIGLWKRIGFVVVALRTTDREPEERKARMFDGVFEPLFPGKHLVVAGQKPGGAHRGGIFRGTLVGRQHVDHHPVVASVGFERLDDPVAPPPDVPLAVANLFAIAPTGPVAVPPDVHPVASPALGVARVPKKPIDDFP